MPFLNNLRAPPVVLRQARSKLVLAGVTSVGVVVLGAAFVAHPTAFATVGHPAWMIQLVGWACMLLFGAGGLAAIAAIWRPITLTLDPLGIEITNALRPYRRAWAEVSGFRLAKMRGQRFVAFDDRRPNKRWSFLNRSLIGADATLPSALTVKPEELLEIVLDAQLRWG